jgi:hypothetical protein
MKIDTSGTAATNPNFNRVHIAAMNTNKRLVYITGMLYYDAGSIGEQTDTTATSANVLRDVKVQVIDSVGMVGRWCALSLDAQGNPWITYMDENYLGTTGGLKAAYKNTTTFYKGSAGAQGYFPNEYTDLYGNSLEGWDAMYVPINYKIQNLIEGGVEHGRLGMECFPTRNVAPNSGVTKTWKAAIGYLARDQVGSTSAAAMYKYRVAYYIE